MRKTPLNARTFVAAGLVFCFCFGLFIIPSGLSFGLQSAYALTDDEVLQQKIDERNQNIDELNKEIQQYTDLVDKTGQQAVSLQTKIKQLEANAKAINLDIQKTQKKIDVANLTIQKLGIDISTSQEKVKTFQNAIAQSVRDVHASEDTSLVEALLNTRNLSAFLTQIDTQLSFNDSLEKNISALETEKKVIETNKASTESQKSQLVELQGELSGKKKAVDYTKTLQAQVLADTKNQEKTYQQTLADKQATKAAFEKDVFDYESQLKYHGNPATLPSAGSSPFAWPLDNVYITQLFGKTVGGEKLYVDGSHNGVDFRAAIGTPVRAVRDGVVLGTGDTDVTCKGASFGRWVFIRHDDGLSSISAHLSVISAKQGQAVKTGDIIGYSGATGYVTGPHLHISVYAADSVSVQNRASAACSGKTYTMPIAPIKAYLDPMLYFPAYTGK